MRIRKLESVMVTLCLLFGYFGLSRSTEDVPEFQYPCYVDICTFPRQFCNSDKSERRCSPCSRSLCKDGRIPLACKYQCNKIQNGIGVNAGKEDGVPWQKHPFWFYSTLGFVTIIVLVMSIKFRRNIIDCLSKLFSRNGRTTTGPMPHETVPLKQGCGDGMESGVESMSSKDDVNEALTGERHFPEVLQNINPTRDVDPKPTVMATSHSKAKGHHADPQSSMDGSIKASSRDPSPHLVTSVSAGVPSLEGACSGTEDLTGDQRPDFQRNTTNTSGETPMATDPKHISGTPPETQISNTVDETAIEMDSVQRDTGISSMTSAAVP